MIYHSGRHGKRFNEPVDVEFTGARVKTGQG
jgi:hypothetical protein